VQIPGRPEISRISPLPMFCRTCLAAIPFIAICLFAQIPSIWIKSIRFEGNKGLSEQRLKGLLRKSLEGNIYAAGNLDSDILRVERTYQEEGYFRVKVGPPDVRVQTIGEKEVADIRIPISEGSVYSVGKVDIRNAQALGRDALMRMCPLEKGRPFSRILSSQWQAKIEEAYHSLGYIRFRCIPREDVNESGKIIDLILECIEGKQYSVGKIAVAGDESIDPLDFKRRLLLSEGGLYNPEMLALSVRFLNETRRYRRISNSDIEIRIDDAKGTVDLEWRLKLAQ
jgi:outer membrane protein assembly factor BamA